MIDRDGNVFEPPKPYKYEQEKCEIIDCPSNSGFSCSLSVYDCPDATTPEKCSHRKFKLLMKRRKKDET